MWFISEQLKKRLLCAYEVLDFHFHFRSCENGVKTCIFFFPAFCLPLISSTLASCPSSLSCPPQVHLGSAASGGSSDSASSGAKGLTLGLCSCPACSRAGGLDGHMTQRAAASSGFESHSENTNPSGGKRCGSGRVQLGTWAAARGTICIRGDPQTPPLERRDPARELAQTGVQRSAKSYFWVLSPSPVESEAAVGERSWTGLKFTVNLP